MTDVWVAVHRPGASTRACRHARDFPGDTSRRAGDRANASFGDSHEPRSEISRTAATTTARSSRHRTGRSYRRL